jgi:hypothetical protein
MYSIPYCLTDLEIRYERLSEYVVMELRFSAIWIPKKASFTWGYKYIF